MKIPKCPNCKVRLEKIVYHVEVEGVDWTPLYWSEDEPGWSGLEDWESETQGSGKEWVQCGNCQTKLPLDAKSLNFEFIECSKDDVRRLKEQR